MNIISYLIALLIPFAVVIWELSLAETMTFYLGNTVLWYVLTMGVFFLAVSLGYRWAVHKITRTKGQVSPFVAMTFLGLSGGCAIIVLKYFYALSRWLQFKMPSQVGWSVLFLCYFLVVFILSFMAGYLRRIISSGNLECDSRKLRNAFTRGVVSATMAFAVCLLTSQDLISVSLMLGLVVIAASAFILWQDCQNRKVMAREYIQVFCILLILILGLGNLRLINQFFLKDFYYNMAINFGPFKVFSIAKDYPDIERHHFSYHYFDIVKIPGWALRQEGPMLEALSQKSVKDPQFPKGYMFFLDGNFVMRSDHEEFYNEYLVHIPIFLNKDIPRRVLIIENGTGLIAREVAKYHPVREITQVSLNADLNDLAQKHPILSYMNGKVFQDNRLFVKTGDAISFLKNTKDTYDAVYIDASVPSRYDHARYYSREFFALIKAHLNKDGYAAFQAPGNAFLTFYDDKGFQDLAEDNKWEYYYHTLRSAGFQTIRPYDMNLELSHPVAIKKMLLSLLGENPMAQKDAIPDMVEGGVRDVAVKESVLQYVYALQEGFIMIKPEKTFLKKEYHEWVDLYALNEARFNRSRLVYYPVPKTSDESKEHSLIRPVLTDLSWWGL